MKSLAALPGEYRRALAAARRYDELKFGRTSITRRQDISRRVFEEFYSLMDGNTGTEIASALDTRNPSREAGQKWNRNGLDQGANDAALSS
jgi:hypothetical protein